MGTGGAECAFMLQIISMIGNDHEIHSHLRIISLRSSRHSSSWSQVLSWLGILRNSSWLGELAVHSSGHYATRLRRVE